MPEFSKHELDRLFQQGAERYDFDYNPAAWEQMAARLDRRRRRALWWWLAGLATVLLAGLACWCLLQRPKTLPPKRSPAPNAPIHSPVESRPREKKEQTRSLAHPQHTEPKTGQPSPAGSGLASPGRKSGENRPPQAGGPPTGSNEKKSLVTEPLPMEGQALAPGPEKASIEPQISPDQPAKVRAPMEAPEALLLLSPTLPLPETGLENREILPIISRMQPEGQPRHSSHLAAGLRLSAGLNSIGWGDFSRSGWKGGLFAEYQYNRRFALELGASLLRLNYLAERGEYIPPKGFWTRRIAPDNTRGLCDILEVPVMMKYYHRGYSGSSFFVSAGLTSYVMLMEEYWYRYALDDPDLIRWWQTGKNQGHWFALGHLSAGYQAGLGERWALQLSPYMQVPISGVGHGQVKIYSLGVDVRLLRRMW